MRSFYIVLCLLRRGLPWNGLKVVKFTIVVGFLHGLIFPQRSSNKVSGWFGAAARNLEPGSPRFHIKVPAPALKVQVPQGSKVPGPTKLPHKVQVPQGPTLLRFHKGSRFHNGST